MKRGPNREPHWLLPAESGPLLWISLYQRSTVPVRRRCAPRVPAPAAALCLQPVPQQMPSAFTSAIDNRLRKHM
eukprot:6182450-Pleurochrysis_carterae.AAC.1